MTNPVSDDYGERRGGGTRGDRERTGGGRSHLRKNRRATLSTPWRVALLVCFWLVSGRWSPIMGLPAAKSPHQYRLDLWQAEQGLPLGSILEILQTSDGYLWIGGYEYLARFDGRRFTIVARASTPELRGNNVYALAEAADGGLWIGSGGGGLTHYHHETFTTYTQADGLAHDQVRDILLAHDGSLWIGTYGGGLSHFDGERFTNYTTRNGLPHDFVWALAEDHQGDLWVGTIGGLARRSAEGWSTYTIEDGLLELRISALHVDRQGILWIGTYGGTLMHYADGTFLPAFGDGRLERDVTSIVDDRDGNLWIGSHGNGLYRLTAGELTTLGPEEGLSSDLVWSLAEDREGSLWIATEGGGLDRLRDTRFTPWTTRDRLPHDRIWVLEQDLEGNMWLGSDGAGLARMTDGEITTYTEGLNSGNVTALHRARDGGLWIGTDQGLHRMSDGRIAPFPVPGLNPGAVVLALWEDHRGDLWVGTEISGLHRIHRAGQGGTGLTLSTYSTGEGLPHGSIRALFEDDQGTLWVGTEGGLTTIVDGEPGAVVVDSIIRSIGQDRHGTLWIGTRGEGLVRIRGDRIDTFTTHEGLPTNTLYFVLEDGRGDLWASSNIGILRIRRDELEASLRGELSRLQPTLYGNTDGMKSVECTGGSQPAGLATREGLLWFPTAKGLVRIDPENLATNPLPPPVHIEEVVADGQRIRPETPDGPIELPPSTAHIDFHYTALSLLDPQAVRFRVQLEGYDANWVDAGPQRHARYTNMPPGDYRFRVIAANNDGIWNEMGATLELTLLPAFHQTRWFYLLWIVLLTLCALAVHRLLVRRLLGMVDELRRTRGQLENKNEEIERRNNEMERFIYTVSHDLKSPLVTIQGYVGMMEKDLASGRPDRLTGDLRRIDLAGSTMGRLLDDLLELSRVGRVIEPPKDISLGAVVEQALAMVAGQIRQRGVEVEVAPELGMVFGDRIRLVQVFQNLLANAVKYMGEQPRPKIEIGLRPMADGSAIYVRDNGLGIDPEDQQKIFGLFDQLDSTTDGTGLGLALVQRIVEVHGGRVWVESEGSGKGSTFLLILPTADSVPSCGT